MSSSVGSNVGKGNGPFNLVGKSTVNRRAIYNQITGVRVYQSDILPAHLGASAFVYMGYVTCPYPNAMIKSIDVSAAEAAGAVTLSALDTDFLPTYNYYSTSNGRIRGPLPYPQCMYSGQPVVAVGAATPDLLNDAINLVKVEYEPLPYVFDVEGALKPGAPQLWPGGNSPNGAAGIDNGYPPSTAAVTFGDAAAAIAAADAVVTLPMLNTQFVQHFTTEPRGLTAEWTTNGGVNIWCDSQWAAAIPGMISAYFMIPAADIVCRVGLGGADTTTGNPVAGCASGNKTSGEEYLTAVALSKKAGSPVKFLNSRVTDALATTARFPMRAYITIAGKAGKITAVKASVYSNVGALDGAETELSEFYASYTIPNVDLVNYSANTNGMCSSGPMRDVGESQCAFFMETAVDMLAEKLNIDPVTFRLNNMITTGYTDPATSTVYPDTAFDPSTGQAFSGFSQPAIQLKTAAAFNWSGRWKGWRVPSGTPINSGVTQGTGKKLRGIGMSLLSAAKGSFAYGTGQISVDPTGAITVYSGIMDHGAGGNTTIPLIAAECLGQTDFSNVTAVMSDTSLTTDTLGTFGSLGTRDGGMGQVAAAQNLASQWFPIVAAKLAAGTQAANLAFRNNTIYDTTNPSNSMSFKAAAALLPATITGNSGFVAGPPNITYRVGGTKMCEVEVDTETADVRVINAVAGIGLGRVIFQHGAESQVQGGFIGHGIGESLTEEHINDSSTGLNYSGGALNANFLDNKVPTISMAPDTMTALYEEYVDPIGPFGATGIGEPCLIGVIPCILNALSNALGGYRFTKTPVRKEDIVTALQWMEAKGKLPS